MHVMGYVSVALSPLSLLYQKYRGMSFLVALCVFPARRAGFPLALLLFMALTRTGSRAWFLYMNLFRFYISVRAFPCNHPRR